MSNIQKAKGTVKAESKYGYMIGDTWFNYVHDKTLKELIAGKYKKGDEVSYAWEEGESDKGTYRNLLDISKVNGNGDTDNDAEWEDKSSATQQKTYTKSGGDQENIMKSVLLKGVFETEYWKGASTKDEIVDKSVEIAALVNTWTGLMMGDINE